MKTVLITGASKGIGLATTKKFLDEGWAVVSTYLNTPVPLQHQYLKTIQYNQGDPASIGNLAKNVGEMMPHLDALINNAGVLLDAEAVVADPRIVRETFEVNVVGVIDITERLLPLFSQGGQIVNMDSGHGAFSSPIDNASTAGYRISKAGLNMYTRHLAFRLKDRGVIVSSIAPGFVKTDMGYSIATEDKFPSRTPEQAADDIFSLVTTVTESGQFWRYGKKQEW